MDLALSVTNLKRHQRIKRLAYCQNVADILPRLMEHVARYVLTTPCPQALVLLANHQHVQEDRLSLF